MDALRVGGGQLVIWNARRTCCPAPELSDRKERRRAQLVNVTMPTKKAPTSLGRVTAAAQPVPRAPLGPVLAYARGGTTLAHGLPILKVCVAYFTGPTLAWN